MDNVRVFVMDNDGNIYHICKYRLDEWKRWRFLEDEGLRCYEDIPKTAVKMSFSALFYDSTFEFIVV